MKCQVIFVNKTNLGGTGVLRTEANSLPGLGWCSLFISFHVKTSEYMVWPRFNVSVVLWAGFGVC